MSGAGVANGLLLSLMYGPLADDHVSSTRYESNDRADIGIALLGLCDQSISHTLLPSLQPPPITTDHWRCTRWAEQWLFRRNIRITNPCFDRALERGVSCCVQTATAITINPPDCEAAMLTELNECRGLRPFAADCFDVCYVSMSARCNDDYWACQNRVAIWGAACFTSCLAFSGERRAFLSCLTACSAATTLLGSVCETQLASCLLPIEMACRIECGFWRLFHPMPPSYPGQLPGTKRPLRRQ